MDTSTTLTSFFSLVQNLSGRTCVTYKPEGLARCNVSAKDTFHSCFTLSVAPVEGRYRIQTRAFSRYPSSHVTEKAQNKIVEEYVEGPLIEEFTAKASALLYYTFPKT
jgi:hypothetical protein